MKNYILLGFILSLLFFSCKKEENEEPIPVDYYCDSDLIETTGLYGTWEIESRTIDNISDASVTCCEYFEFNLDQNSEDFEGLFKKTSSGVDLVGIYVVDPNSLTITLSFNGNEQVLNYSVLGGVMILEYDYNGQAFHEIWKKNSIN